ncbi:nicotinate-nucleotide adenylyltransferase [Allofustis seminis]|uniref:nicotinate-nucleotide adenylyltransferase n=1 Tax=Allofustis seminis TaxID=166939 RepID=UPI000373596B|nr:nicotinate-nucleotide adenylyltransferase [Allofustis seminis]
MDKLKASLIEQPVTQSLAEKERLRVGILGGTFNPPHLGHLMIAQQVQSILQLDRMMFLPTATPPHVHEKKTITAEHRINMLQLAIDDNEDFFVDQYEVQNGGKNYTIDTVRALMARYPMVDFYFVIGADMVEDLVTWHNADELVNIIPFVAVKRSGYSLDSKFPLITVDIPAVDISSSYIRHAVSVGQSIRYLVPEDVRFYIEQEGLYQS